MDKTFQDIHICNRRDRQEFVYREITIEKIIFTDEAIYVSYKDHSGIKMTMEIPKQNSTITID